MHLMACMACEGIAEFWLAVFLRDESCPGVLRLHSLCDRHLYGGSTVIGSDAEQFAELEVAASCNIKYKSGHDS